MKQLFIIKELEPLWLQPAKTNFFSKKILPHMISRIKKISLWVFLSKERLLKAVFNPKK